MPRDVDSSFDPQIVKKRQRRWTGIDEIVLSLTAKGLTTGEISAHFQDIYGASVSKDTISRITDKVVGEMTEWQNRPLDRVYPVMFIDAVHVKVRDGQVTNRPDVCRDRRHRQWRTRHPRDLGRRGRRGRKVLALGPDRDQELVWRTSASLCATDSKDCLKRSTPSGNSLWCRRALFI